MRTLLASKPALFGFATGTNLAFISILTVPPTPSFDAIATFNSVVPLLLVTLSVSVAFVFVPPVIGTRWHRRRLLEQLRRQTTLAARAPMPGLHLRLESVNRDLFQQIVAHTPPGSDDLRDLWIYGYFEETKLPRVHVGDRADIRLMSGGVQLHGKVEGIARGIGDSDNPTSASLLADVSPTCNWIRLAQRVPVRVRIDPASVPPNTILGAGMTATVTVSGEP
ncbi:HlyD family secretion protein [Xanthomonas translucens]|uniref:FUSC family protein n=2 Tax=Xanthomonas translucens pv. translucens TaxID=134875 RepID=A0ABW9KR39_XANCT|nr:FUSC family protein [Xanthomonas translucens]MCC8445985.1 FUSC family protein [Xanthomonas translucens pv. translucens]MCS3359369.1 FUSC family protein [Xanthomonas translucens pv. translucens]MCS3372509.1 FUSC family protein [Xanthomonas translucens pv. translucens]MCT8273304.1 FUSC family protein [Xanthomonas translucens pv. translucens]MCT8277552.1 FUSC family protein [Xanthomonas translucens pv. translucens]